METPRTFYVCLQQIKTISKKYLYKFTSLHYNGMDEAIINIPDSVVDLKHPDEGYEVIILIDLFCKLKSYGHSIKINVKDIYDTEHILYVNSKRNDLHLLHSFPFKFNDIYVDFQSMNGEQFTITYINGIREFEGRAKSVFPERYKDFLKEVSDSNDRVYFDSKNNTHVLVYHTVQGSNKIIKTYVYFNEGTKFNEKDFTLFIRRLQYAKEYIDIAYSKIYMQQHNEKFAVQEKEKQLLDIIKNRQCGV